MPSWGSVARHLSRAGRAWGHLPAAFVLPSTGDALDASLANSATLTGALCFLIGARLLTRTDVDTSDVSL